MRVDVAYGQKQVELEVAAPNLLHLRRAPQAATLTDPAQAVREALESPRNFPPLRQALTPDDHIVIVVDEQLPQLARLLTPVLEHLAGAHIQAESVTLLCLPSSGKQPWLDELPEEFEGVHVEIHDPTNRKRLSYLATTRKGRRVYINRTAVDADQLVVLTRRGYDSLTGYSGAELALFPALSDEATLKEEAQVQPTLQPPGETPWPIRQEAAEVTWLLGAPFFVQVIEGVGSEVVHVLGGLLESSAEGQHLLDAQWRVEAASPADVVIASMSGDAARHDFAQMGLALANAARVVKPNGRIVLLTDSAPELGPAAALLRETGESSQVLRQVHKGDFPEREAAFHWAAAAEKATIYLLSRLADDVAEELLTVPLEEARQVQRLIGTGKSCLFLPEAHKMMAVLRGD